ncbi:hypothetical protein ElyMa_003252900 [Elysia marginata]|uniref:Uncharacterized protein n=1 Tax=Elysia marginata TaxID=1093978 RepID=A0AAV4J827_9GAST|nr:hypothetical protein ElyMa_003252900 [Elysia marginata]
MENETKPVARAGRGLYGQVPGPSMVPHARQTDTTTSSRSWQAGSHVTLTEFQVWNPLAPTAVSSRLLSVLCFSTYSVYESTVFYLRLITMLGISFYCILSQADPHTRYISLMYSVSGCSTYSVYESTVFYLRLINILGK